MSLANPPIPKKHKILLARGTEVQIAEMMKKIKNLVKIHAPIKRVEVSKERGMIESPMKGVDHHLGVLRETIKGKREEDHHRETLVLGHRPIDTDEDQGTLIEPGNILEIKMMIEIIDIEMDRDSANIEEIVIDVGTHPRIENVMKKA